MHVTVITHTNQNQYYSRKKKGKKKIVRRVCHEMHEINVIEKEKLWFTIF